MESNYISIQDISIALLWFTILLTFSFYKRNQIQNLEIKKYYIRNILFKFSFAIFFSIIYIIYYGGGDTTAYWDGAVTLNKLFFSAPVDYFNHLISEPTNALRAMHFSAGTGYPPGWIYREPEAWYVCKLTSIVSIFTFRSYFAGTLIFAFFTARASWRVFEMIQKLETHKVRVAAYCILFVPSVSFWCTGISKDTVIYFSVLNILFYTFDFLVLSNKITIRKLLYIGFSMLLIYHIRSFILAAIAAPLMMAFGARLTNKYERNFLAKLFLRSLILFAGIAVFLYFFQSTFAESMVSEAQTVQQDFLENETYTGKRYELSSVDLSPTGLLLAVPESVFFGIYRPFIYESLSPNFILNGFESLVLFFITFRFVFKGNVFKKIKKIRKKEILVFALIFSIFIAFMAGFTSVLFGVLVRIRAPLLPFIFLVLTTNVFEKQNTQITSET
ncbi:MAG: hypothetical protein L7U23_04040 [Crocinitomicaceae bacterium]|nr:hypothetical protein [Crocinitomicaceae bacterium]